MWHNHFYKRIKGVINKMKKIVSFMKQETVLSVALFLAIMSTVIVPPDVRYLDYIDFRTLAILFCLMSVMAGLREIGDRKSVV